VSIIKLIKLDVSVAVVIAKAAFNKKRALLLAQWTGKW
jgi:hypothetical protein